VQHVAYHATITSFPMGPPETDRVASSSVVPEVTDCERRWHVAGGPPVGCQIASQADTVSPGRQAVFTPHGKSPDPHGSSIQHLGYVARGELSSAGFEDVLSSPRQRAGVDP